MYVTARITRKLLFKKELFSAGYIKDFFIRMFNEIPDSAFDASIICPLASAHYVKICIKMSGHKVIFCSVTQFTFRASSS